jgi:NRAMP (natural resistance-associated macrophage protein)-like metal ion transporter
MKDPIERAFGSSAELLDKTVAKTGHIAESIVNQKAVQGARKYWEVLGPGLTTGASDDDPSGIATYSQTGAQYGFQLLWLSIFTFPLMAIIQEMCARIGLMTGRGLAANIRNYFPRWVLYTCTILLFFANTFNIGADLGAMAQATNLLLPKVAIPLLVVLFAIAGLAMQIYVPYRKYSQYLKWLALILLSYVFSTLLINGLDWGQIMRHLVTPSFNMDKNQIILICGILGTTISPYLFFWQTSQEVEEAILKGETSIASRKAEVRDSHIKDMRIDVWSGMFLSNIVMFFIITACAATLNASGLTNIRTASDAAEALRPLAGNGTYYLFAIGIIGTGLLAIPVLAGSASYAISESFGWKEGLYRKLSSAYAFYGVIILATVIGLGLNFIGLDPIKALIYSAVANGLVAPVVLVLIVILSSNKKVMNDRANSGFTKVLGWIITAFMAIAGIATIYSIFA